MSAEFAAAFLITQEVFWPYFAGTSLLLIGVWVVVAKDWSRARGADRMLIFGPLFLAMPMGVFGADHFISPTTISQIVPSWIPGHLFWVYFVGTALIAAGLSIVVRKHSTLAAALLGLMLLLFVILMHIPNLAADPRDRFALAVLFRDLSFSAGAFALALLQADGIPAGTYRVVASTLRCAVAVAALVFATKHFLHPEYVPVIPLRQQLPTWMPLQALLAYGTGCVLLTTGACMLLDRRSKAAAMWLGIFVFAVILLVYVPLLIATPSDIRQLNYLVDTLAFAGSALLVAAILDKSDAGKPVLANLSR